jgi:hypothetical protein
MILTLLLIIIIIIRLLLHQLSCPHINVCHQVLAGPLGGGRQGPTGDAVEPQGLRVVSEERRTEMGTCLA